MSFQADQITSSDNQRRKSLRWTYADLPRHYADLIWVVPCVGGIDYPVDERAEPMSVTILGVVYEVHVQYHKLRNITYVLLDAPVFRQQTKSEPYPARMDDMTSAIYYSACVFPWV